MAPGSRLLLAIESATPHASVALVRGGTLLGEITTAGRRPHSERLLPAIDRLLELTGVGLADLEGFALSIGPGSFTGLRIGLATLKGLAFGDPRPVAAVPTLAALASSAGGAPHPVVACLDARRGEVYAAGYVSGAETEPPCLAEGVYDPEALARQVPRPCTLVGVSGEEAILATLRARLGGGVHFAPPQPARAFHVARLGASLLDAGRVTSVRELVPRYLRRAEAEVQHTGQRFEAPTPPERERF